MEVNKTQELGITVSKLEDFSDWYRQLITKCKLIHYYDISGCYILLPKSYSMWEKIKGFLDTEFKKRDVENTYFPIFITKRNLEREESHIKGFSSEVAWVTKAGKSDLNEPIAIRPTSETAIYSILPDLIRSYHDLPLKFNQWCNVVRWEFKAPTPFIRSREFLWNEGHTCFSNKEEAEKEAMSMIELYQIAYRKMSIPTIMGYKTEKEKFDGAVKTYTVEGFIPDVGKAIQCSTSHYLGQNFSKMFDIKYEDKNKEKQFVHQNSWGFTTRSIGVMLMTHSDDKGLVIPPFMADIHIAIIPIYNKKNKQDVVNYINHIKSNLESNFESNTKSNTRYKIKLDDRENYSVGWKINHWEQAGIPIRLEIGPRDMKNNTYVMVRRDTNEKEVCKLVIDTLDISIESTLESIGTMLYYKANEKLKSSVTKPINFDEFTINIENKKMCLIPWCDKTTCENRIKDKTTAKSLCIPFNSNHKNHCSDHKHCEYFEDVGFDIDGKYQLKIKDDDVCVHCGDKAVVGCLFGKSY